MTLGELREIFERLTAMLRDLDALGDVDKEIIIDIDDEWAYIVTNKYIYLEFNRDDERFKTVISHGDIRDAMHEVIDMSNNEDQGD